MENIEARHKVENDELALLEKKFQQIAKKNTLRYRNFVGYNLSNELVALSTECKIVQRMYRINDFRASSYAYIFTMRKIEEMINYCCSRMLNPSVKEWCNASSDITSVYQPDGSTKQMSHLGYIYDALLNQQMSIAARYFIEYNIQYLERDKPEKDYPSRAKILESAVWWINQGLLGRFGLKMPFTKPEYDIIPTTVIFSTFPSSGKSYLVNTSNEMFAELNWIINKMGGYLRVGNEQGNIFRQSRQTMALIENKRIFDIYPENKDFIIKGSYKPFGKSSEEEWGLAGVKYDPSTNIFKTRDSAINSVRCKIAAMDDPSRGQQEATNVKIHEDIVQLYRGDFSDRFKNQDDKFIILTGTMFNPNDVFALEIDDAMDGATPDTRFRNTYISKDKKTVVIINDCEDDFGNSAYPEFISDEALKKKKDGLEPYTYACVWRQKPIPAEGLIFAYDGLQTYDYLPVKDLQKASIAYIDPTRKTAHDFFCMPICRYNEKNNMYYLCDAIFEQKSSIDLYDKILEKIVSNRITRLVIEDNVDGGLATTLKEKLNVLGIKWCEITTKYNTVNKAQRIATYAGSVKKTIMFPQRGKFSTKEPLGGFMYWLTQYSATSANRYDDAPDSICGLTEKFIVEGILKNTIKSKKHLPF